MNHRITLGAVLCLTACSLSPFARGQAEKTPPHDTSLVELTPWTSNQAIHVLGMPDIKAKSKGLLAINPHEITFTGKSAKSTIGIASVVALSAGHERVELWGTGGRILRMAIPDGGGIALASVMHHRRDSLTIDFTDTQGRAHSAVFYLPGQEAETALHHITVPIAPATTPQPIATDALSPAPSPCTPAQLQASSILVKHTTVSQPDFPASYRALLYEHIVERLRNVPGAEVHRDGTPSVADCPHYTMHLTVTAYKPGNQVKRAALGPIGMFVGSTQITVNVQVTDANGMILIHDEAKATQRGESESVNVVDKLARQVVKKWAKAQKDTQAHAQQAKPLGSA